MKITYRAKYTENGIQIPLEFTADEDGYLDPDSVSSRFNRLPMDFIGKIAGRIMLAISNYKERSHPESQFPSSVQVIEHYVYRTREEALKFCQCARDGDCYPLNIGFGCGMQGSPEDCHFY